MRNNITKTIRSTLDNMGKTVEKVEREAEVLLRPVHRTVFSRFPILFTLLVTFGVSTTFLAFEKLVSQFVFLNEHPLVMLSIGIGVLTITGTLYKKLG